MPLVSIGVEEKVDKKSAEVLAKRLGDVVTSAPEESRQVLVESINKVLSNSAKRDKKYASYVIEELQTQFTEIHSKYTFKLN